MEKGIIEKVGRVSDEGVASGWIITGGDFPGIDYTTNPPTTCGYTIGELRQIAKQEDRV